MFCSWLWEYLPHRDVRTLCLSSVTEQVRVGENVSIARIIKEGVPQDSSPHLFSVYIIDMPVYPHAKATLFVDTIVFYISPKINGAIKKLQKYIDTAIPWFQ